MSNLTLTDKDNVNWLCTLRKESKNNNLDVVNYNPNHDPDSGKFSVGRGGGKTKKGGGKSSPSSIKLSSNPTIESVNALAKKLHGKTSAEIFESLHYNGLPTITSKELKNPMFRYETGANPEKYKQDLMYGKRHLPGVAVLGSGTYFSTKSDTLYGFGGGLLIKAKLNSSAKVGSIGNTHNLRQKLMSSSEITPEATRLISDYGILASLQGYDAIKNPTTIVVMNRSKLIVENVKVSTKSNTTIDRSIILNEFDEESQGLVQAQQGTLQNTVISIEGRLVSDILNKLTHVRNAFDKSGDVITDSDRQDAEDELEMSLAAFYAILIPLYAASILSSRAKEFGGFTNFKLNKSVKDYIKDIASKTSKSHIDTIIEDLRLTIKKTYDGIVNESLQTIRDTGRSVTDADLVLARSKALEGASQQRIISAVKQEYAGNISQARAKAIARTETNRAFTQSQYQADTQFVTQNGLQDRAYKQWTTRSDHPCAICQSLAAQPPIPFSQNFANIGDELSATYKGEDGKTKVLKQLVNFEELSAGNAHVNCSCRYILVIKD